MIGAAFSHWVGKKFFINFLTTCKAIYPDTVSLSMSLLCVELYVLTELLHHFSLRPLDYVNKYCLFTKIFLYVLTELLHHFSSRLPDYVNRYCLFTNFCYVYNFRSKYILFLLSFQCTQFKHSLFTAFLKVCRTSYLGNSIFTTGLTA